MKKKSIIKTGLSVSALLTAASLGTILSSFVDTPYTQAVNDNVLFSTDDHLVILASKMVEIALKDTKIEGFDTNTSRIVTDNTIKTLADIKKTYYGDAVNITDNNDNFWKLLAHAAGEISAEDGNKFVFAKAIGCTDDGKANGDQDCLLSGKTDASNNELVDKVGTVTDVNMFFPNITVKIKDEVAAVQARNGDEGTPAIPEVKTLSQQKLSEGFFNESYEKLWNLSIDDSNRQRSFYNLGVYAGLLPSFDINDGKKATQEEQKKAYEKQARISFMKAIMPTPDVATVEKAKAEAVKGSLALSWKKLKSILERENTYNFDTKMSNIMKVNTADGTMTNEPEMDKDFLYVMKYEEDATDAAEDQQVYKAGKAMLLSQLNREQFKSLLNFYKLSGTAENKDSISNEILLYLANPKTNDPTTLADSDTNSGKPHSEIVKYIKPVTPEEVLLASMKGQSEEIVKVYKKTTNQREDSFDALFSGSTAGKIGTPVVGTKTGASYNENNGGFVYLIQNYIRKGDGLGADSNNPEAGSFCQKKTVDNNDISNCKGVYPIFLLDTTNGNNEELQWAKHINAKGFGAANNVQKTKAHEAMQSLYTHYITGTAPSELEILGYGHSDFKSDMTKFITDRLSDVAKTAAAKQLTEVFVESLAKSSNPHSMKSLISSFYSTGNYLTYSGDKSLLIGKAAAKTANGQDKKPTFFFFDTTGKSKHVFLATHTTGSDIEKSWENVIKKSLINKTETNGAKAYETKWKEMLGHLYSTSFEANKLEDFIKPFGSVDGDYDTVTDSLLKTKLAHDKSNSHQSTIQKIIKQSAFLNYEEAFDYAIDGKMKNSFFTNTNASSGETNLDSLNTEIKKIYDATRANRLSFRPTLRDESADFTIKPEIAQAVGAATDPAVEDRLDRWDLMPIITTQNDTDSVKFLKDLNDENNDNNKFKKVAGKIHGSRLNYSIADSLLGINRHKVFNTVRNGSDEQNGSFVVTSTIDTEAANPDTWVKGLSYTIGTPFQKTANDKSIDSAVAYDNKQSLGPIVDILAQVYKKDDDKLDTYRDLFAKANGEEWAKTDNNSDSLQTLQYKKDKAGLKGEDDDTNKTAVKEAIIKAIEKSPDFFGARSGRKLLSVKKKKTNNADVEVKFAKILNKEDINAAILDKIIFNATDHEFVKGLADFLEKNLDQTAKIAKSLELTTLLDTAKTGANNTVAQEAAKVVDEDTSTNDGAISTLESGVQAIWTKIQGELTQNGTDGQSKYADYALVKITGGNYAIVKDANKDDDADKYKYSQMISSMVKDSCGLSGTGAKCTFAAEDNKKLADTFGLTELPTMAKVVVDLIEAVGVAKSTDTTDINKVVLADSDRVDNLEKLLAANSVLTKDDNGTQFLKSEEKDNKNKTITISTPTLVVKEEADAAIRTVGDTGYKQAVAEKKYLISGEWKDNDAKDAQKVVISDIRTHAAEYAEQLRPFMKTLSHDNMTSPSYKARENRFKTVFRAHETDANITAGQNVPFNSAESIDSIIKHLMKSKAGMARVAKHIYTDGNDANNANKQLGDKLIQLVRRQKKIENGQPKAGIADTDYDYFYLWTKNTLAEDQDATTTDLTKIDYSANNFTVLKTGMKMISEITLEEWKKIATGEYGFAFDSKKLSFVGQRIKDVLGLQVGMAATKTNNKLYPTYTLLSKLKFFGLPAGSDGNYAHNASLRKFKDLVNANAEALTKSIKSKVSQLKENNDIWSFNLMEILRENQAVKSALGDKKVGIKINDTWKQVVPMLDSESIADYSQHMVHLKNELLKVQDIYDAIPKVGSFDILARLTQITNYSAAQNANNNFSIASGMNKSKLHKYFGDVVFKIGDKDLDSTISISAAKSGAKDVNNEGKKIQALLKATFLDAAKVADGSNEASSQRAEQVLNDFYDSTTGKAILAKTNESEFEAIWTAAIANDKPLKTAANLTFDIPQGLEEDKYDNLRELLLGSANKDSFANLEQIRDALRETGWKKIEINKTGEDDDTKVYRPAAAVTKKEAKTWLNYNFVKVSEKVIKDTAADGLRAHVLKLIKTKTPDEVAKLVYKFIEDNKDWFESVDANVKFKKENANAVSKKVSDSKIFELLANVDGDDSDDKKKSHRFKKLFEDSDVIYQAINTAEANAEASVKFVYENGNNVDTLGEGRDKLAKAISGDDFENADKKQKFLFHALRNPKFVALVGQKEAKVEADNFVQSLLANNPDVQHGMSIFSHEEILDSVDLFNKKFNADDLTNAKQMILFGNGFIGGNNQEETMRYYHLIRDDAFEPTRNRLERWGLVGNSIKTLGVVKNAISCRCGANYESGFLVEDGEGSKLQKLIESIADTKQSGISVDRIILYAVKTKKANNTDPISFDESTVNSYKVFRLTAGRDSVQDDAKYVDRVHYSKVSEEVATWAAKKVDANAQNYVALTAENKKVADGHIEDMMSKIVAEALYIEGIYAPEIREMMKNMNDISSVIASNSKMDTNIDDRNSINANLFMQPILINGPSEYFGILTGLNVNGKYSVQKDEDSLIQVGFGVTASYNAGNHASSRGNSEIARYIGSFKNADGTSANNDILSQFMSTGVSLSGNGLIKYIGSDYDMQLNTYGNIINSNITGYEEFKFDSYAFGSAGQLNYKGLRSDYGLSGSLLLDSRFVNNQLYCLSKSLIEGDVNKIVTNAQLALNYEIFVADGTIDLGISSGMQFDYNLMNSLKDKNVLGSIHAGYEFEAEQNVLAKVSFTYDFKYNDERLMHTPKIEFSINFQLSSETE